jgi:long-subunit acyl-CoA synthetase (AMP-forming)
LKSVQVALLHAGAAIGFFRGDVLKLTEDLQELTPTIFPSVPRLFNRIFDKINDGARQAGGIKASMFEMAVNAKKSGLKGGHVQHGLWDKIVFSKVKARHPMIRLLHLKLHFNCSMFLWPNDSSAGSSRRQGPSDGHWKCTY